MSKILNISEAAALALHAAVLLSESRGKPLSAGDMSVRLRASTFHLAKVLQRLVKAGVIMSTRGPRGGFELIKTPGSISLMEIYEAIEGPLNADTCLFQKPVCNGKNCILGGLLDHVHREVRDRLSRTRLSDLNGRIRFVK